MNNQIQQTQENKNWYDKIHKFILIIPATLIIFSIFYLTFFYIQNGDIIKKDVSLTGGTTITVFTDKNSDEIEKLLKDKFPDIILRKISDIRTGEVYGFFLETSAQVDEVKKELELILGFELNSENSSIEFTRATLSTSFYKQLQIAILIAFIGMGVVVFLIFKTTIPSLAVILAAFSNIILTISVANLLGISMSIAGIVALLMLIGYSVDTDIMLTYRVLRGDGKINQRIYSAFKTGITMTLTSLIAVLVSLILTRNYSSALDQIFTILLIGISFDIFNTWVTNASIIKWYAEIKKI